MEKPAIFDRKGREIQIGSKIDEGDGIIGSVTGFREPDESHWLVEVEWPDSPGHPELFSAPPHRHENGPLHAYDIEIA